jgi:hypothetical protein
MGIDKILYLDPEEFFKKGTPVTIGRDVQRDIELESMQELIDPYFLEMGRIWSELGQKYIGVPGTDIDSYEK